MNKTTPNKVRYILVDSCLSKRFWAEIVATTYYLINAFATLNFKTLIELWSNILPQLNHLKPFGYLAYTNLNQGN